MTRPKLTPYRGVFVTLVLLLGIATALFVLTRDAQEVAEVKTQEAQTEGAKADAATNTVEAICEAGDQAACRLLEQLDAVEPQSPAQDDEVQEPEVQEPEVQEPELQNPESDDVEIDQPERQDPEIPDAETDDPEVDQPEQQDGESQDPEVDDPDTDDPESQDEEVQDPEIDDPDPNDPEEQDAEIDDPDPASPFTFSFTFTVPSDLPNGPPHTYSVTCDSGTGACSVSS